MSKGSKTGMQFGYNCKHYFPKLNKCFVLANHFRKRKDLLSSKQLNAEDLLLYMNLSCEELIKLIYQKEIIPIKPGKDKRIFFQIETPWQWDNCFLTNGGGQCLFFEAYEGKAISCIMDRSASVIEHANHRHPSEEDIKMLESIAEKLL